VAQGPGSRCSPYHGRDGYEDDCDVVDDVSPCATEREVRGFGQDEVSAPDEEDGDGRGVGEVKEERAAGDVGVESDFWAKVEEAEGEVKGCLDQDCSEGHVEFWVEVCEAGLWSGLDLGKGVTGP
jgi:hypothetical protein